MPITPPACLASNLQTNTEMQSSDHHHAKWWPALAEFCIIQEIGLMCICPPHPLDPPDPWPHGPARWWAHWWRLFPCWWWTFCCAAAWDLGLGFCNRWQRCRCSLRHLYLWPWPASQRFLEAKKICFQNSDPSASGGRKHSTKWINGVPRIQLVQLKHFSSTETFLLFLIH